MKKMMYLLLAGALVITVGQSCKKKMSDADITKGLNEKMSSMTPPVGVAVKDGAVTLTGACKDSASYKAAVAAVTAFNKDLKVTNNCTVAAAPVSAGVTVMDMVMQKALEAGLKDIPAVKMALVAGKAMLTGAVTTPERTKIMQLISSAKAVAFVDVKGLTNK